MIQGDKLPMYAVCSNFQSSDRVNLALLAFFICSSTNFLILLDLVSFLFLSLIFCVSLMAFLKASSCLRLLIASFLAAFVTVFWPYPKSWRRRETNRKKDMNSSCLLEFMTQTVNQKRHEKSTTKEGALKIRSQGNPCLPFDPITFSATLQIV